MKIRTDEITSVIKQEIEQYASQLEISEVGQVVEVGDGIARIYGLSKVMASELLEFETNKGTVMGQAMNLEEDTVGAVSGRAPPAPGEKELEQVFDVEIVVVPARRWWLTPLTIDRPGRKWPLPPRAAVCAPSPCFRSQAPRPYRTSLRPPPAGSRMPPSGDRGAS